MLKIKLNKSVILFLLFFSFICFNNKSFAEFKIANFNITAVVDESGDMSVVEEIDYYTDEKVNGLTREIETKNTNNIKNSADGLELYKIKVDNILYEQIPEGTGNIGDNYVYEYESKGDNYSIKIYSPFETHEKKVIYDYKLKNVAVKYNDIGEIYWNFIGDKWDCNIDNLDINIILPEKAIGETSYVFGHGSDNGTFSKNDNYIYLHAKNIKAFQVVDARILFSKKALKNSTKIINKNVLDKYINEEEGIYLEGEKSKIFGIFSINQIAIISTLIVIICTVFVYLKYDRKVVTEKYKYFRELPYKLEPEILQYLYYKKIKPNSFLISLLTLVKLGVYSLEKTVNESGKEVLKIIYNENNNADLKPYQITVRDIIYPYLEEDENQKKSIDILALSKELSKSSKEGYIIYKKNLKLEKKIEIGNDLKIPLKIRMIPIILFLILILICCENTILMFIILAYTCFFYNLDEEYQSAKIVLITLHILLISVMVISGIGVMYIPVLVDLLFMGYVNKLRIHSNEESTIIKQIIGLKNYIKDFSFLDEKDDLEHINLWEDYFIMAIALKLNKKIINYFYDLGKEQTTSNLGSLMSQMNTYNMFYNNICVTFYNYHRSMIYKSNFLSSGFSGSDGSFSGESSSGGGGRTEVAKEVTSKVKKTLHFKCVFLYKYLFYEKNKYMKNKILFNILIGFLAGMISGFFGAGGGLILVPYMTLILKEDEVKSRATTILCIFFMVLTSSFFYFNQDSIDWYLAFKCAIGGVIGGYVGSKLLINLNKKILKILFIIFLIYAGIKMII